MGSRDKLNSIPLQKTLATSREEWPEIARKVLELEAQALAAVAARLDRNLTKAVDLLLAHAGKVVVSGIGKSGHIGQKIAATLASTGTPAVFLHAAEAVHGDLAIYTPGDPSILISKSGSTAEFRSCIGSLIGTPPSFPLIRSPWRAAMSM